MDLWARPDLVPTEVRSHCNSRGSQLIRCKPDIADPVQFDNEQDPLGTWTTVACPVGQHCKARYADEPENLVGEGIANGKTENDVRSVCEPGEPPLDQPCSVEGSQ
jgi:hypothetical protein